MQHNGKIRYWDPRRYGYWVHDSAGFVFTSAEKIGIAINGLDAGSMEDLNQHLNNLASHGEAIMREIDRIDIVPIASSRSNSLKEVISVSEKSELEMESGENGDSFCRSCNQPLPMAIGYRDSVSVSARPHTSGADLVASSSVWSFQKTISMMRKFFGPIISRARKSIMENIPNVWYFLVGLYLLGRWVVAGTFGIWVLGSVSNALYFHHDIMEWHEGNLSQPYLGIIRTWILGLPGLIFLFVGWSLIQGLTVFGEMHVKDRHVK